MLRRLITAGLVAGALASYAPVAHAAGVSADCGYNTFAQETATGNDTYTGVAHGYAFSDIPGVDVSVSCEIRVNDVTADATTPGRPGQVSTTVDQVTFYVPGSDFDAVTLCAVWWTDTESGEFCSGSTTTEIPPDELPELPEPLKQTFDFVLIEVLRAAICFEQLLQDMRDGEQFPVALLRWEECMAMPLATPTR